MDEEASEDRLREGMVIAGKYELNHVLGSGGMGLVIAATHLQLERRVAIKFLLPQHLAKPDVVGRFTREARSAAKIQSDHVAHVLDVGVDEGTPYMVMEYLEGEDLKQVLQRRGPLSVDETVRYVRQACEALVEAHALGIVHRDLKPANLFLATRPHGRSIVKLLDFGISKIMNPATETELTLTSRAVGSPSYMSPEQLAASRSLDARADIWALGVVLYELLTKQRPFRGETMPSVVALILKGKYEKLDTLRADIPAPLVAAVHKCLELEPENRFASVGELMDVLAAFAPTESFSSVDSVARASMTSLPPLAPTEDPSAPHGDTGIASVVTPRVRAERPARSRLILASGAIGFLGAVAVGGFLVLHPPGARAPVAANSPVAPTSEQTVEAAPEPVAPVTSVASAATTLPAALSTESSARAATEPRRPITPTVAPRAPVARPPVSAAPSASAVPACHLVSYFDGQGDKHFKQECP